MKAPITHQINSRLLTTFDLIENELQYNKEKNYLFKLSHLGLVDVSGDKAMDFLQGQLTCDLRKVSDIQMIQGAQCNLKGRILSVVDILNWNGFKIILPEDILDVTINSLSKTAQLSRVSLQENKTFQLFGFYLQNPQDIIPDSAFLPSNLYACAYATNYCYYHLGNGFYIFLVHCDLVHEFCSPFINSNQLSGSLTWHTLRLRDKEINIYPESRGLFLPHRLDLQLTPYISFDKGCYRGQEIIARTHYKATLKHELKLFEMNTANMIYSGQKIYKPDVETEIGELIDYSILGKNHFLIAASMLKNSYLTARLEGHSESVQLSPFIN